MIENKKTIDLSNVDLEFEEHNTETMGLTGLDLGLEKFNEAEHTEAVPESHAKKIDLSRTTATAKDVNQLLDMAQSSSSQIASQISQTKSLDDTEEIQYQDGAMESQRIPEFASSVTESDPVREKDKNDDYSLSSFHFEDNSSTSGMTTEPSRIENMKFHETRGVKRAELTGSFEIAREKKKKGISLKWLALALMLGGGYWIWAQEGFEAAFVGNTVDRMFALAKPFFSETKLVLDDIPATESAKTMTDDKKARKRMLRVAPRTPRRVNISDIENPYWPLPNPVAKPIKVAGSLTPSQKEKWRFGLSHRYPYRRYSTIKEIRASHIPGSEALLFEALEQPKLWARMEALLGLVELGLELDIDTIDQVISGARPHLLRNYFRKLSANPTAADFYVMRQAIRVVDAQNRLQILKVLVANPDNINSLYYAAARFDPSRTVSLWLSKKMQSYPVPTKYVSEYRDIAASYLAKNKNSSIPEELAVQEIEVEELSDSAIVKEVSFFQDMLDEEAAEAENAEEKDGFDAILNQSKVLEKLTE